MRSSISLFAAAAVCIAVTPASAVVVYSNGPTSGTTGAGYINGRYALSDSATLTRRATITSVDFTVWVTPGETPSTVDWAFTTTPNSFPAGSVAPLTVNYSYPAPAGQNGAYTVEDVSFGVPNVVLDPGTWYLVLHNGFTAEGGALLWDVSNGSSIAYQETVGAVGSQTFTLHGGVPEPEAWALMLMGFGLTGGMARLRRKPVVAL
jgi:hypothetical protein